MKPTGTLTRFPRSLRDLAIWGFPNHDEQQCIGQA
jgi:hypothetical protein